MSYINEDGGLVYYTVSEQGALKFGGHYYRPGDRIPCDGYHQTASLLSRGLVVKHVVARATTPKPRVEDATPPPPAPPPTPKRRRKGD